MKSLTEPRKLIVSSLLFLLSGVLLAAAAPGRYEKELSGEGWRLFLDKNADWKNDPVFMPPVNVSTLPVNPPACGWDDLERKCDKVVSVPGTVEEHFWGVNGNPIGVAGDWRGVSWWSTTFLLDSELRGKRITLRFESVNLRAEVFVNRKQAGYDVIGNTPFEVDITGAAIFGMNRLDVRITDPVGNFTWEDNDLCRWGKNLVPAVHGFGGITGRVYLRATDRVYIDDVYVENKPVITEAEIFAALANSTGKTVDGMLVVKVHEWRNPANVIWEKAMPVSVPAGEYTISLPVKAPKAKPWAIRDPHLYVAAVKFTASDGSLSDMAEKRFGFRYFTVGEKNGDKRFYLNGKRVFIFAAMTRGFWPKTGMNPTAETAGKDIEITLRLGYNMMLFHRAIGQSMIIDLCDEAGLLVYEEPSGYRCEPAQDETVKTWRREKLRRMVMRERSNPSFIICNLVNEAQKAPSEDDIANVRMVHSLDPGRILTYTSHIYNGLPYWENRTPDPYKLHMLPFDSTLYTAGWFDQHHWFRYPGYVDECYRNPRFFARGVITGPSDIVQADSLHALPRNEIIFWGEEGQWGTMMRLEKIRSDILRSGATGWRERMLLHWYDCYERFLDESHFRSSFPTVDDLTLSMGRNLHYYHGRMLENARMGNLTDGFNLNGWAAPETSEDIADAYRYPTADPSILSYYARPLYIAVKIPDKVLPAGAVPRADFFIINETDVKGKCMLEVKYTAPDGVVVFTKQFPVNVLGGEEYGQLLVEGVILPPAEQAGYYTVSAELRDSGGKIAALGHDECYAADYRTGPGIRGTAAVIDTSGVINDFLKKTRGITLQAFDASKPDPDIIIIGAHDFRRTSMPDRSRYINTVMDRAANGTSIIILDQADKWAELLNDLFRHAAIEYKRSVHWGADGRFIAGKNLVFNGLPQSQAMNWEYQSFYHGDIWGLDMTRLGTETIVALACENRPDILDALVRIPYGRGEVYLSTLRILPELASTKPESAVAKKLFLNMVER
ncbi:MAG: glycoside hydrolase family 2 TIM barrel-domain containing protein [Candidatus Latescibacter sp.]|nr:glycoside hydrolase family 2 TIM barrel-domain containing protein [Candidatus Latescibacter sp.]